jgi:hypothetical protein
MKKTKQTSQPDDPAVAAAQKLHREIVAAASDLQKKWTVVARKCLTFREAKYYKKVVSPDTGKPFTSFTQWAKSIFDQSKSTLFAAVRIMRELDGIVSDEDMAVIGKENNETLVTAKNAGEDITPELIEAAKKEPAREFRKHVASVRRIDEKKESISETQKLGPFRVSKGTANDFQRAFDLATTKTATEEGEQTDRAIGYIARHFLAATENTGEQEVAA